MRKPNFFIVGAAKAGTTSFAKYLEVNPEIFISPDKEPAYFSDIINSWPLERYLALFEGAGSQHKAIGEASTIYLTDSSSARHLYGFNPEAKIIIILRNPVDRAVSLYRFMVLKGYEYAYSFERALELEPVREKKKIPSFFLPNFKPNYLYMASGLYCEQVKRFTDLFGANVLFLKFEDMVKDPKEACAKACKFLGVGESDFTARVYNKSSTATSAMRVFIMARIFDIFRGLNKKVSKTPIFSDRFREWMISLSLNDAKTVIKDETRAYLNSQYSDEIKRLEKQIGLCLCDWLSELNPQCGLTSVKSKSS